MGNVYFMKCRELVKIGYAADVGARLAQLQTGNPQALTILAVIPDAAPSLERIYHRAFADARVRGEWFDLVKLRKIIAAIQMGKAPRSAAAIQQCLQFTAKAERPAAYSNPELQRACREIRRASKQPDWRDKRAEFIARGGDYLEALKIMAKH